jgi:hypothetical protein
MRPNYKDELRIKKRKKVALIALIALFIIVAACVGLGYLLFFANLLDVRIIDVSGAEIIPPADLKTAAEDWFGGGFLGITRKRNLLFVSVEKLAAELTARFPRIESVEIGKEFPHELKIKVVERQSAGIWCFAASGEPFDNAQGRCFYFDKNSVAYAEAAPSSGFLILNVADYRGQAVALGSRVSSEEWTENIIMARELLPKIGINIAEISIPSGSFDEFDAKTAGGWKILFSNSTDIAKQIASLGILFRDKLPAASRAGLQHVDLRIQDRIYYK